MKDAMRWRIYFLYSVVHDAESAVGLKLSVYPIKFLCQFQDQEVSPLKQNIGESTTDNATHSC